MLIFPLRSCLKSCGHGRIASEGKLVYEDGPAIASIRELFWVRDKLSNAVCVRFFESCVGSLIVQHGTRLLQQTENLPGRNSIAQEAAALAMTFIHCCHTLDQPPLVSVSATLHPSRVREKLVSSCCLRRIYGRKWTRRGLPTEWHSLSFFTS